MTATDDIEQYEMTVPSNPFHLGEMTVMFDANNLPPKMWKALACISECAHPSYDEAIGEPGLSRDKCLFMSLAVRDFLVQIGFTDATVRGCAFVIRADDNANQEIWSLGIGVPGLPDIEGKFNGHAVVTVPSLKLLLDMTCGQAIRPHWRGSLSPMMALRYHRPWQHQIVYERPSIAGLTAIHSDRKVEMCWTDRPELAWRKSEDFRIRNYRRVAVTKAIREAFGNWRDSEPDTSDIPETSEDWFKQAKLRT